MEYSTFYFKFFERKERGNCMDISIGEWKKSSNTVLIFIVFLSVGAAGFTYLYIKKPAFNINIDVAIVGSLICCFAALFFFFRLLRRGSKKQEIPLGYHIGSEEPFGC